MPDCIRIPKLLLPRVNDLSAWSVIACDQFTSDEAYWREVERLTQNKPSSFQLVLPEIYLKEPDVDARVRKLQGTMKEYLAGGVFLQLPPGFILVERQTRYTDKSRFGLMLCIDLEEYSFENDKRCMVRSSEATVSERMPARVKIRRGAALDMPHTMLLYDDPQKMVLGDLIARRNTLKVIYDFELNMGGGHVRGYFVPLDESEAVKRSFYALMDSKEEKSNLLFAAGDGNHTLAAAKAYWDEKKEDLSYDEKQTSPFRFALAEAVNIYDDAVTFYPVYRFVRVADKDKFFSRLESYTGAFAERDRIVRFEGFYDIPAMLRKLDAYVDAYIGVHGGSLDFVYGEEELRSLVQQTDDAIGFILNGIDKNTFFRRIEREGSFPQKTFSLGCATEKRYYLECREL